MGRDIDYERRLKGREFWLREKAVQGDLEALKNLRVSYDDAQHLVARGAGEAIFNHLRLGSVRPASDVYLGAHWSLHEPQSTQRPGLQLLVFAYQMDRNHLMTSSDILVPGFEDWDAARIIADVADRQTYPLATQKAA